MIAEVVEALSWVARLIPLLFDLREALKTGDPAQEYAANTELLRQMRLQIREEKARETKEAIARDVFLNSPFPKQEE